MADGTLTPDPTRGGDVERVTDSDYVAGGVNLEHHTHPGDSGDTTGEPA